MMELSKTFNSTLDSFLQDWKTFDFQEKANKTELTSEQLIHFFTTWKSLFLQPKVEKKAEIVIPNINQLDKFFCEYSEIVHFFKKTKEKGMLANVWSAANLGRNEVRNSKTLRWFLDASETHGQGDFFLNVLLNSLSRNIGVEKIEHYFATEECCPLGEQSERVDIEIDGENFLLFIEVKIDATQGVNQLARYQDTARVKAGNRPWKIIYLTPTGKVPKEHRSSEYIIGLSWKNFANQLRQEINTKLQNHSDNLGLWLGKQFYKHILTF